MHSSLSTPIRKHASSRANSLGIDYAAATNYGSVLRGANLTSLPYRPPPPPSPFTDDATATGGVGSVLRALSVPFSQRREGEAQEEDVARQYFNLAPEVSKERSGARV